MSDPIDTSAEAVTALVAALDGLATQDWVSKWGSQVATDASATLSALLARCETLDQHAKDVRKECERLAVERDRLRDKNDFSIREFERGNGIIDDLRARLEMSEALRGAAHMQLTTAQARVQELESKLEEACDRIDQMDAAFPDTDYGFAVETDDLRAALASQSPEPTAPDAQKGKVGK